jgi:ABC-2 type transport system ATP-binding protein
VTAPLQLRGVSKALAGAPVLRDVTFSCPRGAITALLGPNGAGKPTPVAIAVGQRAADAGAVTVLGEPARSRSARTAVSLVPQDIGFPASVQVERCLEFVAGQRPDLGLTPPRTELLHRLGIARARQRRVGALSGGQQRKLAIALALVHAPPVLVMDEATTNLDEQSRATTWSLVRDYVECGGAALVTSHILADIDRHADRVVALAAGRVVLDEGITTVRRALGGSVVTVRVGAAHRDQVLARVAEHALGSTTAADVGTLSWRSPHPVRLVVALHELLPDLADVQVQPIPLRDVLTELADTEPAELCRR